MDTNNEAPEHTDLAVVDEAAPTSTSLRYGGWLTNTRGS